MQHSEQIRRKCKPFVIAFFVLSVFFVYVAVVNMFYNESKASLLKDAGIVLEDVIDIDRELRFKETNMPFYFSFSPKDTSKYVTMEREGHPTVYLEKEDSIRKLPNTVLQNIVLQSVLLHENPIKISRLDSLFHQKLQEKGIQARTAMQYTDNTTGQTHYSIPDSSSYKSFFAFPKINTGIQSEITLEAFVKLSPLAIVGKSFSPIVGIILIWLVLMGMLAYVAFHKPKERIMEVVVTEPFGRTRIDVREDLCFDMDMGCFLYKEEEIKLTTHQAKFFGILFDDTTYFATYDNLIAGIYNKVENGGKSRLEQLANRIRCNVLVQIPGMELETVSGRGYRLRV